MLGTSVLFIASVVFVASVLFIASGLFIFYSSTARCMQPPCLAYSASPLSQVSPQHTPFPAREKVSVSVAMPAAKTSDTV